ncbi:hypothetical protein CC99x_012040 [Candidatus Berkiella cookevillensis]|uniref:Uncharacterized protein n=1 Tax=Candidatus Berkiella cookevillensis TaxID=437022 RepID=A0A0Q9YDZ5_9GAMM|nr:hypothetical protein [Candidatus Berkiella cookevillensis]MCS5709626.1 hypothetical protein [Candidatus Berkiella cookevillensis]
MLTAAFRKMNKTIDDIFNHIKASSENIARWIEKHSNAVTAEVDKALHEIHAYFLFHWNRYKPKVDKISQATTVVTTATSTFKTSTEVMPILFSVLPIITGIPIIGLLLPEFFLTDAVLATIMVGVAGFVAYLKYIELQERDALDHMIVENQNRISALESELAQLKQNQNLNPDPCCDAQSHAATLTHQFEADKHKKSTPHTPEPQHTPPPLQKRSSPVARKSH